MNKHVVLAGNLNLNVLDFENNKKVENFISLMFYYDMILTTNKPAQVTANTATRFFANVGPILVKEITESKNKFESYLVKTSAIMQHKLVLINELRDVFFSLKLNKSPGHDEISFNKIKKCFSELYKPLKHVFNLSIETGVLPDKLKIARVPPTYKAGDSSDITNYRPISVLPSFSKILERIMHNCLFPYMSQEKILYSKQLGFQSGHSTEHTILQLANQIHEFFENNFYSLGVFIDS